MTDQMFAGFEPLKGNFTQVPNQVFELLPQLTGGEIKCLLYIVRHTLGFHDKTKTITTDEFEHGRKRKDSTRIDEGVGLKHDAIVRSLKSLADKNIITREIDSRDKARQKITYGLNLSENQTGNLSENQTTDVRKSDTGGLKNRHRSVKETIGDKPIKDIAPAKAARPRNLHFDIIVEVFRYDVERLTTTEKKHIGKVASELRSAGYAPTDIPHIYAYCVKQGYTGFTPAALSKHAGAWKAAQQNQGNGQNFGASNWQPDFWDTFDGKVGA